MAPMRDHIHRQFRHIGARARLSHPTVGSAVAVEVRRDRRGQYFDVRMPRTASAAVLNANKLRRHLLLLVSVEGRKSRFVFTRHRDEWLVSPVVRE
jgi:hypothetical protein